MDFDWKDGQRRRRRFTNPYAARRFYALKLKAGQNPHVRADHREYQVYGVDAAGKVTHAGVHAAPNMSEKSARRLQRKWLAWREQYLRDHAGDYPLRHAAPTVRLVMYPVAEPGRAETFNVADAPADFQLANDPPKPHPASFDSNERSRQQELFVGRRDLAGQTYLIPESNVE